MRVLGSAFEFSIFSPLCSEPEHVALELQAALERKFILEVEPAFKEADDRRKASDFNPVALAGSNQRLDFSRAYRPVSCQQKLQTKVFWHTHDEKDFSFFWFGCCSCCKLLQFR